MTLHIHLVPVLAIAAGVAILLAPRLFHIIVAAYLIVIGVIGIIH